MMGQGPWRSGKWRRAFGCVNHWDMSFDTSLCAGAHKVTAIWCKNMGEL